MDFGFTAEQRRFRAEVRDQLLGPAVRAALDQVRADGLTEPDLHPLYRVIGELGLLAVHWPAEYGGAGRSPAEAAIVAEELVRCGVPDTLHVNTIQIVGQFIAMAGTHEQRLRYLPGLARGERFASVLYTEPEAGSDLGSLATVAEPGGDGGYQITGTKVFSLKTRFADLALCAARTGEGGESKYQGISLFVVDLTAPGVHVSVIPSIADEQFHRVELNGVPVPASALIGAEGEGWALLNSALEVERTGLDYFLKAEHWFGAALDCLTEPSRLANSTGTLNGGQGEAGPGLPVVDPGLIEQIGRYGAELRASHLLAWNALTKIMAGRADQTAAAVAKYHASELASSIAGWAAALPSPAQRAAGGQAEVLAQAYREAPGLTLSAGTSEVMLQLVAAGFDTIAEEAF
ncbi:MAG TPA: acyl-CoA dehydrogenase family protein [Streptosporangiaceae bacterium]|jgi:alkylation response protein AidB-like acyl-CoA dehydrogenase|nr:acyl-CoA dehydrogenase family protein [Streptosporangiaceae bacterium]